MPFRDETTRRGYIAAMRSAYNAKALEDRGIPRATLARLKDPAYLPSRDEILDAFGMHDALPSPNDLIGGSRTLANTEAVMARMARLSQQSPENTEGRGRSFEDNYWLHVGPATFGPMFAFCEAHGIFEVLTEEYVGALADHLAERCTEHRDYDIVEVGAGSGRLAHFLNQSGRSIRVVATDDGSWQLAQKFPVLCYDANAAVEGLRPAIVLCSWMPENTDFTEPWRYSSSSVREYCLVGPSDSGLSGLPWETWGFATPHLPPGGIPTADIDAMSDQDPKKRTLQSLQTAHVASSRGDAPPYAVDGFEKTRADVASSFQISRRDCSATACGHSETWSFVRKDIGLT